jgi:uncharacterized protein
MTTVDLGLPGPRPHLPADSSGPVGPPQFHVLAKPTGAICNLDCSYCFFLSKEELYPGSAFRMDDGLLREYLRQLLEAHRSPDVTVAWQGGEPTMMGLPFFRRVVELVAELERPDQRVVHALQTNATLVDDAWASFLAEHDVLVGVSVDGPARLHDAYRVDKGGKPTHHRVVRGLAHLQAHGVRWNALTTVNHANEAHGLEVYRYLRDDLGAEHVQLIPVVERPSPRGVPQGDEATERSVSPEGYGRFLVEVFDEWVRRDVGRVFVQMFDSTLASFVGVPGSLCVHSATCGTAVALEHNGDVYSCDHFVDPDHLLGNIAERHLLELVASPEQVAFGRDKRDALPAQCRACDVRFACHGGCPKDRFTSTADGEPGLNYLCPSYQTYFRHVHDPMRFMASEVRFGGRADRVMEVYRLRDERRAAQVSGPPA